MLTISSGLGAAQLLTVLATPFLARSYLRADFGVLYGILATGTILSSLPSLRYESAILLNTRKGNSENVTAVSLAITLVITVGIFGPLGFVAVKNGWGSEFDVLTTIVAADALCVAAVLTNWCIFCQRFKLVAVSHVIRSIVMVTIQIAGSHTDHGAIILVTGFLGGLLAQIMILGITMVIVDRESFRDSVSLSMMRQAIIEHKRFAAYGPPTAFLNRAANQLPNLIFLQLFGAAPAGEFAMSFRLTRAPLSLLGQSAQRALAQEIGRSVGDIKRIGVTVNSTLNVLIHLGGGALVLAFPFIDQIALLLLGAEWAGTGILIQLTLPWLYMTFLSWPMAAAYNTVGSQRALMSFNASFAAAIAAPAAVAYMSNLSLVTTVMLVSLLGCTVRFIYIVWILNRISPNGPKRQIVIPLCVYTALLSGLAIIVYFLEQTA